MDSNEKLVFVIFDNDCQCEIEFESEFTSGQEADAALEHLPGGNYSIIPRSDHYKVIRTKHREVGSPREITMIEKGDKGL